MDRNFDEFDDYLQVMRLGRMDGKALTLIKDVGGPAGQH
jgi:hypothetical protein